jgi:hypothetical protein
VHAEDLAAGWQDRASVDEEGTLELASGTGESSTWSMSLRLLETHRPGSTESLASSPAGVTLRVSISNPPPEAASIAPLSLDFAIGGTLSPYLSCEELSDGSGKKVLRIGPVVAKDALDRALPASLEMHGDFGGVVRILIDDTDAVYPLSVELLSASPVWFVEGSQVGARLGAAVATAGDVNGDGYSDVIVGAPGFTNGQSGEGRALVYLGSAVGLADSPAWTAEGGQGDASFGSSVSTAGDVNGDGYSDVVIGAPGFANGESGEGRAYVYLGSASGLAASPAWTVEGNQIDASLGSSVSTAGDIDGDGYSDVVIGAPGFANGESGEGRAYVYLGSAGGLVTSPSWSAESNQVDASFGASVSTAGDVNGDGYGDVIVGAPGYDAGQNDEGRAFTYLGSASGLAAAPVWTAESNQDGAELGASVATAGDVDGDGRADVIVGAPGYDNGQSNEGRAYVFQGTVSGVATTAAWTAEGDQADAAFGTSVATAGDVNGDGYADVIVGAPGYDNGQSNEGRAWVRGSASGCGDRETAEQGGGRFRYFRPPRGTSTATASDVTWSARLCEQPDRRGARRPAAP